MAAVFEGEDDESSSSSSDGEASNRLSSAFGDTGAGDDASGGSADVAAGGPSEHSAVGIVVDGEEDEESDSDDDTPSPAQTPAKASPPAAAAAASAPAAAAQSAPPAAAAVSKAEASVNAFSRWVRDSFGGPNRSPTPDPSKAAPAAPAASAAAAASSAASASSSSAAGAQPEYARADSSVLGQLKKAMPSLSRTLAPSLGATMTQRDATQRMDRLADNLLETSEGALTRSRIKAAQTSKLYMKSLTIVQGALVAQRHGHALLEQSVAEAAPITERHWVKRIK